MTADDLEKKKVVTFNSLAVVMCIYLSIYLLTYFSQRVLMQAALVLMQSGFTFV